MEFKRLHRPSNKMEFKWLFPTYTIAIGSAAVWTSSGVAHKQAKLSK